MQSSAKKNDKLASVFLVTFLLMGSAHFACRYDVGNTIDTFFHKASAETLSSANSSSVANNTDPIPLPAKEKFVTKSISRNPFQMPASAMPRSV